VAKSELSFEVALKELEKIVEKLESPDLTLTSALEQFEKGVALMKTCDSHLRSAEGKIKELLAGKNGEFIETILGVSSAETAGGESTDE
jgi:exodeoxyribonuclease VII small subunit